MKISIHLFFATLKQLNECSPVSLQSPRKYTLDRENLINKYINVLMGFQRHSEFLLHSRKRPVSVSLLSPGSLECSCFMCVPTSILKCVCVRVCVCIFMICISLWNMAFTVIVLHPNIPFQYL